MTESSTAPPRRSRRRRFQYGLRALLFVILLAAVLVAWQRERLARWVESLWPSSPAAPMKDAREPRQIALDFLDLRSSGKLAQAEELFSSPAKVVLHRVLPPGGAALVPYIPFRSDDLINEVVTIEHIGEEARVKITSTILMQYSEGQIENTYILRDRGAGWRITGIVAPADISRALAERTAAYNVVVNLEDEASVRDYLGLKGP